MQTRCSVRRYRPIHPFMIFNSFQFIWLFPIVFIGYYLLSYLFGNGNEERQRQAGNVLLLAISYGLYAQVNAAYTLILLGVTAITYSFALLIEHCKAFGQKRYMVASGVLLALLPLLVFKYYK